MLIDIKIQNYNFLILCILLSMISCGKQSEVIRLLTVDATSKEVLLFQRLDVNYFQEKTTITIETFNNDSVSVVREIFEISFDSKSVTYYKKIKTSFERCFSLKMEVGSCSKGWLISPRKKYNNICYLFKDENNHHHIEITSESEMGRMEYTLDESFVPLRIEIRDGLGRDIDTYRY